MLPHQRHGDNPSGGTAPKSTANWPPIAADDLPIDILMPRLRGVTQQSHYQWSARCPAHADGTPSLSITETGERKLLIYCHARDSCTVATILAAVSLKVRHLYPTDYAIFRASQGGKRKTPSIGHAPTAVGAGTVVPADVIRDMTDHARCCYDTAMRLNLLPVLAEQLGLPCQTLIEFGVGYELFKFRNKWTFFERDGQGRIVGIVRRDHIDAGKFTVPGGRRGLIVASRPPAAIDDPAASLYIPEGHTDTIALHSIGCLAIGRPAARLSGTTEAWLVEFLRTHPQYWQTRPLVITGDNDAAGQEGAADTARRLGSALGRIIKVAYPPSPHKDMRDWISTGTFIQGWPYAAKKEDQQ